MAIQRSASRRRLVLFNERSEESQPQESSDDAQSSLAPVYSRRALPRWLPTVASLAPDSWWKLILCWVAGVGSVAGLLALHSYHHQWESHLGAGALSAFDLSESGNLAASFVFMSMIWGSMLSLVIYFMRRHRVDDYRGGYRIWITSSIVFAVVAVFLTTNISDAFNALLFHYAQWPSPTGSVLWTPMVFGPLASGFTLRMAIEIRESRLATLSLALAALLLATGLGLGIGVLSTEAFDAQLAGPGLTMLGCFQLVFAAASFSRFVLLDAQGKIVRKVAKQRAEETEEATDDPKSRKVEAPTLRVARTDEAEEGDETKPTPKPKPKPKRRKPAASTGDPEESADSTSGDPEEMTKTERRKQRKMKRRERRSAA